MSSQLYATAALTWGKAPSGYRVGVSVGPRAGTYVTAQLIT